MSTFKKASQVFVCFVASLIVIACGGSNQIPTHHAATDTASCDSACKHLRGEDGSGLNCPEGQPLQPDKEHPKGQTCTEFCEYTQSQGHALHPSCVVNVKSCEEIEPLCQRKSSLNGAEPSPFH
jgi:hypothetical protein